MTVRAARTQPSPPRWRPRAAALAVVAIVAAACARAPSRSAGAAPGAADGGAASPSAAVAGFVAAARSYDARTMGLLFGTAAGPVAGRDPSVDVEKRMRALACYLTHDSARVVDDLPAVGAGTRRMVTVALRQRELARDVRFTAVPTARGRWLVESFDIERLSDFCRPGG